MSNNTNNSGCAIVVVLAIIVGVILYLVNDIDNNPDSYAQTGSQLMMIASGVIVYFIYKFFQNSNNETKEDKYSHVDKTSKQDNDGCGKIVLWSIAIIALFSIIYLLIGQNFEFNKSLGIAFVILVVTIIFIIISVLRNNNDD